MNKQTTHEDASTQYTNKIMILLPTGAFFGK